MNRNLRVRDQTAGRENPCNRHKLPNRFLSHSKSGIHTMDVFLQSLIRHNQCMPKHPKHEISGTIHNRSHNIQWFHVLSNSCCLHGIQVEKQLILPILRQNPGICIPFNGWNEPFFSDWIFELFRSCQFHFFENLAESHPLIQPRASPGVSMANPKLFALKGQLITSGFNFSLSLLLLHRNNKLHENKKHQKNKLGIV